MVGCSDQSDVEAGGGLVILFHAAGVAPGCKRGVEQGYAIFAAVYAHRQVFGVSVCDLLFEKARPTGSRRSVCAPSTRCGWRNPIKF